MHAEWVTRHAWLHRMLTVFSLTDVDFLSALIEGNSPNANNNKATTVKKLNHRYAG